MSANWLTIALLALVTIAIKATGPLVLRTRTLSVRVLGILALLPTTVLTALVVYETLGGHPNGLVVDARLAGLAAAGLALYARLPMIAVVIVAAAVTAGVRAVA